MKKSLLFLILFSATLNISFESTCIAQKKDITKISKEEQPFYEKNRWDYLELALIDKFGERESLTKNIINYAKRGVLILPVALSTYFIHEESDGPLDLSLCYLTIQPVVAMMSGIASYLTGYFGKKIFNKKIKKEKLVNILEALLEKYDPDLDNDSDDVNYKKIIPEELYELFDGLYKRYMEHGKKYLEDHNLLFIKAIKDKIRYEIKKDKYDNKISIIHFIN